MRVFITSVPEELDACQFAAVEAVRSLGHEPVLRDPAARLGLDPVTACTRQIALADAVLAVVGFRRGRVPSVDLGGDGLRPRPIVPPPTAVRQKQARHHRLVGPCRPTGRRSGVRRCPLPWHGAPRPRAPRLPEAGAPNHPSATSSYPCRKGLKGRGSARASPTGATAPRFHRRVRPGKPDGCRATTRDRAAREAPVAARLEGSPRSALDRKPIRPAVEDLHNAGVRELGQSAGLATETLPATIPHLGAVQPELLLGLGSERRSLRGDLRSRRSGAPSRYPDLLRFFGLWAKTTR